MSATEQSVGILHFLVAEGSSSQSPGTSSEPFTRFTAIIKQRCDDFCVEEVNNDGQVASWNDAPERFEVPAATPKKPENGSNALSEASLCAADAFSEILTVQDMNALKHMLTSWKAAKIDAAKTGAKVKPFSICVTPRNDKAWRTSVHHAVRASLAAFNASSESVDAAVWAESVGTDEAKAQAAKENAGSSVKIIVGGSKKKNRKRGREHSWPRDRGEHTRFILRKVNTDSHHAIVKLAKAMRVKDKIFSVAGTKDKRAVTCQFVTGYRVNTQSLAKADAFLSRYKGLSTVRVRPCPSGGSPYTSSQLGLGDLSGNKFTIILRNVLVEGTNPLNDERSKTNIEASLLNWKHSGFINYFGLQRFGTGTVPTHAIGRAILKKDWKGAIDLILDPRSGEKSDIADARTYFKETGDARETLRRLPIWMTAERSILGGIEKYGKGDPLSLIRRIPRTLRMLYVHAYQSFLWNKVASARFHDNSSQGLWLTSTPQPGDLVFDKAQDNVGNAARSGKGKRRKLAEKRVKHLSQDDIAAGGYTIADVLLPIPGSDVDYPTTPSANKETFEDMLREDGLDLACFRSSKLSDFHFSGDYRSIAAFASECTWKWIPYSDPMADLSSAASDDANIEPSASSLAALMVSFQLRQSTYATMCLRQIMKSSARKEDQTALNASCVITKK